MSYTNISAFQNYMDDQDKGNLILSMYSIDPTLSDKLEVSMALGMIERADDVDYKQLNTSETLSETSRKSLRKRGLGILNKFGIDYIQPEQDTIIYGSGF
jgi:hypothetical protein